MISMPAHVSERGTAGIIQNPSNTRPISEDGSGLCNVASLFATTTIQDRLQLINKIVDVLKLTIH